jgi:hypothetical protein
MKDEWRAWREQMGKVRIGVEKQVEKQVAQGHPERRLAAVCMIAGA